MSILTPIFGFIKSETSDNIGKTIGEDLPANWDKVETQINSLASKVIAESGRNENGNYVKFEDGTMICSRRLDVTGITPTTATEGGLTNYRGSAPWTYSATFVGVPSISFIALASQDSAVRRFTTNRVASSSSTSCSGQVTALETFNKLVGCNFIAIGRWKE